MRYAIDFEYHSSEEVHPHVVCGTIRSESGVVRNWWLDGNRELYASMVEELRHIRDEGGILVSHQVGAEARCLDAMGLDPKTIMWIDTYLEWRQAQNCNNKAEYGTYFKDGMRRKSLVPYMDKIRNKKRDCTPIGSGLSAACGCALGIDIDSRRKDAMRDLILSKPKVWTEAQKKSVMEYCASDTEHLFALLAECVRHLRRFVPESALSVEDHHKAMLSRGMWSVQLAQMETLGIPLDVGAAKELGRNFETARFEIIQDLNSKGVRFYEQAEGNVHPSQAPWVCKYEAFEGYLKASGLANGWPKTDSGRYSMEDDVLKEMEGDPGIRNLRDANKAIKQIGWFRPEAADRVWENVGSDGRLRVFLAPFGTQTGRNAPKPSKGFIPAMSSWLRCLIRPPEGYSICGIDYASQEFAGAAVLSKDLGMMEAYASGDPYLHFAKLTGAVPKDGTKKTHPFERNLAKSTVLGLQYGMGSGKLSRKLTVDTGKPFSREDADAQIGQHKRAFPKLWSWREAIIYQYHKQGHLLLPDGWALLGDNPSDLSVGNFPVQGMGSTLLRETVSRAHAIGIGKYILFPLHDAVYALAPDSLIHEVKDCLCRCMDDAVTKHLGSDLKIRLDADIHSHEDTWVEEKGAAWYEKLKHNLVRRHLPSDSRNSVLEWVGVDFHQ